MPAGRWFGSRCRRLPSGPPCAAPILAWPSGPACPRPTLASMEGPTEGPGIDRPAGLPPLTRDQILVSAGVMAALAVADLDSTVVGKAMPTIIGQLGGLSKYSWVFSGYLLAATTTVPLYAKLADAHGRKPDFRLCLSLFVGCSALCGLSRSM